MSTILVTGFGPFEAVDDNPSETLARTLGERDDVDAIVIPVTWDALDRFAEQIVERSWRSVVMLGVAVDRRRIGLERVALNLRQLDRADAAGAYAETESVVEDAPDAYFSTLPIHTMLDELSRAGHAVEHSLSAGAYLCNALFFRARHALAARSTPCGFVHVPPTDVIPLDQQSAALHLMLDVLRRELAR